MGCSRYRTLIFIATPSNMKTNVFQEDKGPKNYSWRKEMESYEENLEKINSHKKVVHDSTKSAR